MAYASALQPFCSILAFLGLVPSHKGDDGKFLSLSLESADLFVKHLQTISSCLV